MLIIWEKFIGIIPNSTIQYVRRISAVFYPVILNNANLFYTRALIKFYYL